MKQTQIAVHHTAVGRNGLPQLYAVNRYHKQKWGMKSSLGWYVGYNFFVDESGVITQCRSLEDETVANVGHNCDVPERCDTISVCFSGNGDVERLNTRQEQAWREFIENYPNLKITLHRDIQANRTCPGTLIDVEYLNGLLDEDPNNDKEKQEEIEKLQRQIDVLRSLIKKLLKALLKK